MRRLKKNIKFFGVYAIATGTTLSAGFFLLPGLAAVEAGSALIFAYIIAAIPLIPAMYSKIELATAMPRAGGVYYILDRTLGPYFGTIGGIGTWLALVLKVSFALIGMGAYLGILFPSLPMIPVALGFAILLGIVNLLGSKKSGSLQIILVMSLLAILTFFIGGGIVEINPENFTKIFDVEVPSLLSTAGLVFISYIGITKVVSLSEEIEDPERNIPKGIFWALGTAIVVYVLGTTVMVGLVPMDKLAGNLTPAAIAAEVFSGKTGIILVSFAALLAFISVANAGILSASRYPFAMSRDHIMPEVFKKINSRGTPVLSVLITVGMVLVILVSFDPTKIAKLASAFQLFLFALLCFSVIIMRESKIESYDPGYLSPLYPWMQLIGIITSLLLIFEMGFLTLSFSLGLLVVGTLWYLYYVKGNVIRTGAIYNIFERLGQYKYAGIDYELRDLMKRKPHRKEDPFDQIVAESLVIDEDGISDFEEISERVSNWIAEEINYPASLLQKEFMDGTRIGATPVIHQIALPHLIIEGLKHPKMVLVRSKKGIRILYNNPLTDNKEKVEVLVKAVFFLLSPKKNPAQHLRILARIAGRVEENSFMRDWNNARDNHELKVAMLHYERFLFLKICDRDDTIEMAGKKLKDIWLPEETLVAWIKRNNNIIIPEGNTIINPNDIFTIIGEPERLDEIVKHFHLIRANFFE